MKMKIEILGPGCARCHATEKNVSQALQALNMQAELVHIYDPKEYAKRGVLFTPASSLTARLKSPARFRPWKKSKLAGRLKMKSSMPKTTHDFKAAVFKARRIPIACAFSKRCEVKARSATASSALN
jgi:hypothetical protein